eukprot:SM000262S09890  [mRNA]  locus=s262:80297:83315:- [translate_table: standard]
MVEATELLWRAYHVLEMELAAVTQALLCLAVALPFCFYWYLWTHPRRWVAWCRGADPCRTMARTAHLLKLVQAAAVLSQSTLRWPPWYCVLAIAAGQALNIRVYQLLGESGVYYGVRFGKYVPWVVDFPFTYIQDPQYIGSILTLLGCLCWAPWLLIAVWAAGYLFMIVLERHENVKTRAKPQPQPPQRAPDAASVAAAARALCRLARGALFARCPQQTIRVLATPAAAAVGRSAVLSRACLTVGPRLLGTRRRSMISKGLDVQQRISESY